MMKLMAWKLFPNNSRAFIGGWVIAAISILGLNLGRLGDLHYPPMAEKSPLVNTIRFKLYQLEQVLSERKSELDTLWDRPVLLTNLTKPPILPKTISDEFRKEDPPGLDKTVLLPKLSGIMMVGGNSGKTRYSAVLNGKVCSEKEKFNEFKIEEISSNGVLLTQNKRSWFVPAPEVYYSVELRK
jgi:hypothetical protein